MAMYVAVDCLDQGDGAEGQGAREGGLRPDEDREPEECESEQQREALVTERTFHNLRGTRDGAH